MALNSLPVPAVVKANPEVSRHAAVVALALLTLTGLLVSVFVIRSPIHKEGECVVLDFVLFPTLTGHQINIRPPQVVNYLSQGNAELTRRMYQHFFRHILPDPKVSFTFSPASIYSTMSVVALQAQPGTTVNLHESSFAIW